MFQFVVFSRTNKDTFFVFLIMLEFVVWTKMRILITSFFLFHRTDRDTFFCFSFFYNLKKHNFLFYRTRINPVFTYFLYFANHTDNYKIRQTASHNESFPLRGEDIRTIQNFLQRWARLVWSHGDTSGALGMEMLRRRTAAVRGCRRPPVLTSYCTVRSL